MLRLREGIRANIVTVVISIVVGLYMVEGGLTFLGLGQPHDRIAAARTAAIAVTARAVATEKAVVELDVEYDQRTILEVIEGLNAQGVDAVPEAPGVAFNKIIGTNKEDTIHLLTLGGVSNKTTVCCIESGKYMVYKSDRYGFNNPNSEWNTTRVDWLLTGDSFAVGQAVQEGEDIAGQIRVITNQSAISLGSSGNGPLKELAALIEYAGAIKPRKVFWIYYEGNDLTVNLRVEKSKPLLMKYMEDGFTQNLINRQKEIDRMLREYIVSKQAQAQAQPKPHSLLYKTRWTRLYAIRNILDADDVAIADVDYPLFARILTKAKVKVEAWGGELYFVYLPEYERYNKKVISQESFRNKSKVIEMVKELHIPVIDIHQEVFADHPDPLALFPLRLEGHYNAEGYSEVAKAIITGVKK
ncbi:hypothetical protein N8773_00880 [Candidatus Pseudothioglobus singularis]|nr:hypothetical protein [Candidatus Pseudothioglobus singularis]